MSETENAIKQAKIKRRNGKAALTRHGKTLRHQVSGNRPAEEVRKALQKYEEAFSELLTKHEEFTMLLEDDSEFEHEEAWMEDCQEMYLRLKIDTEDYLREIAILKEKEKSLGSSESHHETAAGTSVSQETTDGISVSEKDTDGTPADTLKKPTGTYVSQNENHADNAENHEENSANHKENPSLDQNKVQKPADNTQIADNVAPGNNGTSNDITPPANASNPQSAFRMKKPKMPKFSGDVREFAIFKADFKHLVESRYSKRDAITILRANLHGKPLELIKGIGQDYDAAWEYLESIYGDPRFVADTITQDIARFKPLRDEEDARFCDLVHLVRRSFNTLTEVGRQNDMDNNHMLAIIEQKMWPDDRKVWSRFLESKKSHATLEALMSWMTSEMKSRMRATAPLRSSKQNVTLVR